VNFKEEIALPIQDATFNGDRFMRRILAGAFVFMILGCKAKEEAKPSDASVQTTQVDKLAVGADALSTMQLSASLSPAVPTSVSATGAGIEPAAAGQIAVSTLTLAERKKSIEACYIRQKIRESKANQESMAMQICYIESQRGMKSGGKYKMSFSAPGSGGAEPPVPEDVPSDVDPTAQVPNGPDPIVPDPIVPDPIVPPPDMTLTQDDGAPAGDAGGEMALSIFLDNSTAGKFTVFMCDNDKLSQKIVVENAGDSGAKGSYKAVMDMGGAKIQILGAFDNGVGAVGHQRSASEVAFEMDIGGAKSYLRSGTTLDLAEKGISVVKAATETSTSAGDFSNSYREIGAALIGPNIGSALFQRTVDETHPAIPLLDQVATTTRSYFDSAGKTLAKSDSDSFSDGGILAVSDTLLPKLVSENFKVDFESTDWDCSGTEAFTMDTESADFKACTDKFASQFTIETCGDAAAYEIGSQAPDVSAVVDQRGGDEIPVFEEPSIEPPPPDEP
jgi:hypothetical protein